MAIQFARVQYVSRSSGGNACRKSAYNARESTQCDRTGELFYFKHKSDNVHHEVLLPQGAHAKFKEARVLWNAAERMEKRHDSQVAKESVIALPDNKEITFEDRIDLTKRFAHELFVSKGLGVQIDIHEPHDGDHNWHAHLLITTRRFTQDGLDLESKKARDLDPTVRRGKVVEAHIIGQTWARIQNDYFKEKGLAIEVDPIGMIAQDHLGPVRMRHHLNDAMDRSDVLKDANEILSQEPQKVLDHLTQNNSLFSQKHLERFLDKFHPQGSSLDRIQDVLNHESVVRLYDTTFGMETSAFTTKEVLHERDKVMRFADKIHHQSFKAVDHTIQNQIDREKGFSQSQSSVFKTVCGSEDGLILIQGRAGTGKTYVLDGLRQAYETEEQTGWSSFAKPGAVIGLAPTNKVALDLKDSGFENASTVHKFLFDLKNGKQDIASNTTLIVDEAAMLSNEMMIELLHGAKGSRVILVGDDRQLSSVNRGGMFTDLCETYGASTLSEVRRQKIDWQKQVSELLSNGDVTEAVQTLKDNNCLSYHQDAPETLAALIETWAKDVFEDPSKDRFMLSATNVQVDALNLGARQILKGMGLLEKQDYLIQTTRGRVPFSVGDRIQIAQKSKELDLMNGAFGTIINLNEKSITLEMDSKDKAGEGRLITFDPSTYQGLRHGYAGTVYKAQGATIHQTYVLHAPHADLKSNYVALTRQSESMKVFIDQSQTKNDDVLAGQLSRVDPWKTIPSYLVPVSNIARENAEPSSFLSALKEAALNKMSPHLQSLKDYFHANPEFYAFKDKPQETHHVIKVEAFDGHGIEKSKQTLNLNSQEEISGSLSIGGKPDKINHSSLKGLNHAQASEKISNPEEQQPKQVFDKTTKPSKQTEHSTPATQFSSIEFQDWQKKEAVYNIVHAQLIEGLFTELNGYAPSKEDQTALEIIIQRVTEERITREALGLSQGLSLTKDDIRILAQRIEFEEERFNHHIQEWAKDSGMNPNQWTLYVEQSKRLSIIEARLYENESKQGGDLHTINVDQIAKKAEEELVKHESSPHRLTQESAQKYNVAPQQLNSALISLQERYGQVTTEMAEKCSVVIQARSDRLDSLVTEFFKDTPHPDPSLSADITRAYQFICQAENEKIFTHYIKTGLLPDKMDVIENQVENILLTYQDKFEKAHENNQKALKQSNERNYNRGGIDMD